jgi:hypothetical protein
MGFVALVSGCGSSSPKNASASDANPTPAVTLSDPEFQAAAGAVAASVMLKLDDFPAGWHSEPRSSDSGGDEFGSCDLANRENPATESPFDASSDEFKDPNHNIAELDLDVFKSSLEAQDGFIRIDGEFARCRDQFTDAMKHGIEEEGGSNPQVSVNDLRVGALGADTRAYRVAASFTAHGVVVPFTEDIILIRIGSIVADVFVTMGGGGSTFPADLARTVAGRMTAANAFLPQ